MNCTLPWAATARRAYWPALDLDAGGFTEFRALAGANRFGCTSRGTATRTRAWARADAGFARSL